MNAERDAFRTTLRVARLCLELDCNTIFDSARKSEVADLRQRRNFSKHGSIVIDFTL